MKNEARHTYHVDEWSKRYCFNCPLPDCVSTDSPLCPLNKARKIDKDQKTLHLLPLFANIKQPGGQA